MGFDRDRAFRGLVRVFDSEVEEQSSNTGTGVLVQGGCILTATHNFYPNLPDPMAYRRPTMRLSVKSLSSGATASLMIAHADTCLDSTILGASGAHGNLIAEEAAEFEKLKTEMTPQSIELLDRFESSPLDVWIFSQEVEWIKGSATIEREYPHYLLIDASGPVIHGMSGGPVFSDDGSVVGSLLGSSSNNGHAFGNLLSACLPGWALDAIRNGRGKWLNEYSQRFLHIDLDKASNWGDWTPS